MLRRIGAVSYKEVLHILRDPRTLAVMFLIPVVQLFLLGYAATTDVKRVPMVILDWDRTAQSQELIDAYRAVDAFRIIGYVERQEDLARLLDAGTAQAALLIPRGYGSDVIAGRRAVVGLVIDGSDPTVANNAYAAALSIAQHHSTEILRQTLHLDPQQMPGLDPRPRVWYNPELRSANYMIPGLIGAILQFLTMLLTAQAIVREREQGTMEQLIVTPIRPMELVIGKVAPYVVIAFVDFGIVLALGAIWFRMPIRGDMGLLFALSSLFLISSLGFGLLISTVASTQREAMLLTYFLLLPAIFLSGLLYPIQAMPTVLQWVSYLIPLRYMLIILRAIIVKGVGIEPLWDEALALTLFGFAVMGLAARRFRKRLE
ncbi:ABC transporter permease [Thermoflexus sp.]|uniref:ABC transporter permease n=1 Tax=Thermoflexus sp. TaxID=1969742 RepID=UPI0025CFD194|nr:ABC transporter permease [Thermoflexus sp.]MDW8179914.1 ABC transporter permease [Anaerolineae bacterium]MCS6963267.1 ABC transporter permease [Thermoflexus sp.]MCS7350463.1 ABC transporter permease [Thermoflexus sp.]MCX7689346.1 ABC transporter permease [Thermoflexus sp.]MDW8185731.1 ABC transporter permease [Anaerolineae bacterium]